MKRANGRHPSELSAAAEGRSNLRAAMFGKPSGVKGCNEIFGLISSFLKIELKNQCFRSFFSCNQFQINSLSQLVPAQIDANWALAGSMIGGLIF
jgi:hypothetical protein